LESSSSPSGGGPGGEDPGREKEEDKMTGEGRPCQNVFFFLLAVDRYV